ncbi:armadillo-type protein [Gorgonomyces haynaldii]|nr:armadillo-type protein [Gorgonomyces haynaldii]
MDADDIEEMQRKRQERLAGTTELRTFSAPKDALQEVIGDEEVNPFQGARPSKIISERESDYHQRRLNRELSPERVDPFKKKHSSEARSYREVMKHQDLDRERHEVEIELKKRERERKRPNEDSNDQPEKKQRGERQSWEDPKMTESSRASKWDDAPAESAKKSKWDDAPTEPVKKSKWDEAPVSDETPKTGSRWSETPVQADGATPKRSRWGETPVGVAGLQTPTAEQLAQMTPKEQQQAKAVHEANWRNRFLSDEDLNTMIPVRGYTILEPPQGYVPIQTPARKLTATPTPMVQGFDMPEDVAPDGFGAAIPFIAGVDGLNYFKAEDAKHFASLMEEKDEMQLSMDEIKERKIMRLLLKIKNGQPHTRKQAMRQITDGARLFGPQALFNQILPLLMSPTLEDQERHLLVKVIDRVMFKLDDLVRPFVHKILVVIEPMLIDEDFYTRAEGREIISNLAKAAGLATMISNMRPDIDHVDEYVRNTTSRAFAVVAGALGIPALLPFLKAVCRSTKSWQARHTGAKIIQQIAILMGAAILPHLRGLVEAIAQGLEDEQQKVRTMTALAIAALAEASFPYGIESFDPVIDPLKKGLRRHRGKPLAAFFKAVGYIIPLFGPEDSNRNTREIMTSLVDQFETNDPEMKKIVLKVLTQCVGTEGLDIKYLKQDILPKFFREFWIRSMALDRRNYKQLVETTVALAQKVGVSTIVSEIVDGLKDESEPYRRVVVEAIEAIVKQLGSADMDDRLVELLLDGLLFAFQEQTQQDSSFLNGFGTVVNALGERVRMYLPQICSTILWRLNNKSANVRQQSADLISQTADVMKVCGEEKLMGQMGVVLYEYLGEEFPEVLGSIIRALKAIVNNIGMPNMTPPIKDLLPRLTPILKNRHEKVQEHTVDLVGRIADRGAEFVSAREWMRICFELLEMLKAPRRGIRRSAINTFGYIAKAIGPQDVLTTLLNNLKVQERQMRVCTTIAIAIVAETCGPFTIMPALMNEYRVPEMNVQNGVLKSFAFLFEYIGEMSKDYIYAASTILEDALMDRDMVHRQTACTAVKHMALGVVGLGFEDILLHMLNLIWPNVLETSPHIINSVIEALDGLRVGLGPCAIFQYTMQGLFHPARRVRQIYWKIYNNIYVGHQDAMVAFYPRVESTERNDFSRWELDTFI